MAWHCELLLSSRLMPAPRRPPDAAIFFSLELWLVLLLLAALSLKVSWLAVIWAQSA